MQISSRFTIAIHMLTCMEAFKDEYKVTSDFLASSINVNPVVIRRILSQLKDAGLIFRGSSNQNIIDMPKSLAAGRMVLLEGSWRRTMGSGDIDEI